MKFIYLFLFISIIIISNSCEYQPTGSNYVKLDSKIKETNIEIYLPEENSLIAIESDRTNILKYELKGDTSKLIKVVFYLDNSKLLESKYAKGSIKLNLSTNQEFEYRELNMFVYNHSGTGSMADKLEIEGTQLQKTWDLEIYNWRNFRPNQLEYKNLNGSLQITWKSFPFSNFKKYELTKVIKNGSKYYTFQILNKEQNWFFDTTYIGEEATYSLKVYYSNGNYNEYKDYTNIVKPQDLPKLSIIKNDNTNFTLQWSKSNYSNNLSGYLISSPILFQDIKLTDPNLNSYTINNLQLGMFEKIKFYPLPKGLAFTYEELNQTSRFMETNIRTGDSTFSFNEIASGNNNDLFFTKNFVNYKYEFVFSQLSLSNQTIINNFNFSTTTSYSDRLFVSPLGKCYAMPDGHNVIYSIDGVGSNIQSINEKTICGKTTNYGAYSMAISDNGILAAYFDNIVYVYDLKQKQLICKIMNAVAQMKFSTNGDFLVITTSGEFKTKLYKIENNSATLLKDNFIAVNFDFDPNQNSRLIYYDYNLKDIFSLNCETQKSTQLSTDNLYYSSIDFRNDKIITYKTNGNYEIRNLSNFQKIYSYKSQGSGFIHGNTIYFGTGVKCSF